MARNPVGPLAEEGFAVAIEHEALSDGVGFAPQLHIPTADLGAFGLGPLAVVALETHALEEAYGAQFRPPVPPQHIGRGALHDAVVGQVVGHIGSILYIVGEMPLVVGLDGVELDGDDVGVAHRTVVAEELEAVLAEGVVAAAHPPRVAAARLLAG